MSAPPFDELNFNFVEGHKNPESPTITPTKQIIQI